MRINDTPRNLRESLGFGLHGLATEFVQGLGDHRSEGCAADSNGLEQQGMAFGDGLVRELDNPLDVVYNTLYIHMYIYIYTHMNLYGFIW